MTFTFFYKHVKVLPPFHNSKRKEISLMHASSLDNREDKKKMSLTIYICAVLYQSIILLFIHVLSSLKKSSLDVMPRLDKFLALSDTGHTHSF